MKDEAASAENPLKSAVKRILRTIYFLPDDIPVGFGIRWRIAQCYGINRNVPWPTHFTSTVYSPERIKRGIGTYPGDSPGCYIQAANGIEIGDYTNLGPGVGLISANHDPLDNSKWLPAPPIKLGKHCWLGMHAVVLPGVELGDYTTVGAGAVVTKSFPEGHCIIAGNPARVIRKLEI